MFSMKNAALVGLASADRTLFAPVAAPYGQVTPAYDPAVANAYALSADTFAQPVEYVQPQYVQPEQRSDSTWLWFGAGALALVGAAAARSAAPSPVAALDEEDLESARIATLAVGGKGKKEPWSLSSFLMSGRKSMDGKFGEGEFLSGAFRKPADDPTNLNNRFKILYDERSRKVAKKAPKKKAAPVTSFRSKNPSSGLYPK